ncbi:MAG: thiolase family protein [Clostridia bacterium]|nr:thiolase family protein [Clostridia bacterium]
MELSPRTPVVVEAIRTPIGRRGGALRQVPAEHLAAFILTRLFARTGFDPASVDDVVFGCVDQVGEQSVNVGRNAWLAAGLPVSVPAVTLDRQCGSSQTAVQFGAALIEAGLAQVVVAGGVESMTRVPMLGNMDVHGRPYSPRYRSHHEVVTQGQAAERIALRWDIGREEMDRFGFESHRKAARAVREGRFARELEPVPVREYAVEAGEGGAAAKDPAPAPELFAKDEGVRMEPSLERMAELPPAFAPDGRITAGSASQISDGAAAVLLMSWERAKAEGLPARAALRAQATVGVEPELMLTGPIPATRRALAQAGLSVRDVDLFECNEAFASVVLAWEREIGPDPERVNVNGGAIALGHPLGASGARILATLLHEMERRDAEWGLQTMCCGGGLGVALVLERL